MKIISPPWRTVLAYHLCGRFARRAELFFLLVVSSPRRRLYPPAWKPYGLEAEPEAEQEKETSLCGLRVSNDPELHRRGVGGWKI